MLYNVGDFVVNLRMFSTLRMRMMAGVALLAATAVTVWAGEQDFTLVNKTGFTISSLYVAPTKDRH